MKINLLRRASLVLCALSLFTPQFLVAQKAPSPIPKPFELTVDSIMRGPRLVGYTPTGVYWSQDSQKVYFRWKQAEEPRLKEMSLYVVNRDGSGLRRLSEEEARLAPPANGELSKDKTKTLFAEDGNVFLYDHVKRERRTLIKTSEAELNPHFTFDQKSIYFTRQNNLYVMSIDGSSLEQLTDIRIPSSPSSAITGSLPQSNDGQEFLKKEERTLLDAVRERAEQREEQEAKRKQRDTRKPFNLATGESVGSLNLTPNGKFVIAGIAEPSHTKGTIVPNYVTESGY